MNVCLLNVHIEFVFKIPKNDDQYRANSAAY